MNLEPDPRVFPSLTAAQIKRIAAHGKRRKVASGDILVEPGQRTVPFFVVDRGEVQVFSQANGHETFIVAHGPGHFSGEANMITGRRALARLRVREPGDVI